MSKDITIILDNDGEPAVHWPTAERNPYPDNEDRITGTVGSISLTKPDGQQQNSTVLDLGNFSTLMVEVPSPEVTLVLRMEPSANISFKLLLGYGGYPSDDDHVAQSQMPLEGATAEEAYTWVLGPEERGGFVGLHYLVVKPIVEAGVKSVNTTCLCNHLTMFGSSFFVMPNLVDVSRTAELFATFTTNPVVVCFVGAIFVVYLLVIIWARRKDIQDLAKVAVTLQGTEGESEPHHLTDSEKPVFERGGMDMFLLTTPFSLGELQSIRVWHDNSGEHPACNLFFMKTAKDFRDGHIWFSVISRPPCSTFTRVQRVSCCFSLLLCTMLTSIMFWGIPTDPSEQTMDLGHIEFTWQQVMIGFQSSIIMFPINLLIVSIFRNTRPRQRSAKPDTSKPGKSSGRVCPSQSSPQKNLKDISPDTVIK
ncbi:hypothetical protein CRUP_026683, partial [Coryphaenoides rupestris]